MAGSGHTYGICLTPTLLPFVLLVVMTAADVWSAEQLMGVAPVASAEGPLAPLPKKESHNAALLWGLPGHLTKDETDTYFAFRQQVEQRGGEFRDTVYAFGEQEGEVWALCRWLRARKFVLVDVLKMVEEATECRAQAKDQDFYPNAVDALGCDSSLFYAQYPQLYSGCAKNGSPIFISKPGILNVDGMECITTLDGILKFHWHVMMHDFKARLLAQQQKDPSFKRFECFCILDLDKLTMSQLSKRAMAIVKEQSAIDSICFPETMNKMLIVNAPSYFAATWRVIKGWLDPRTANKIEVISNRAAMEKRLLELVDAQQLPCDYGGKGPDTRDTMHDMLTGGIQRMETSMIYLRGHGSHTCEVRAGEEVDVHIYTRSTAGAKFALTDADAKNHFADGIEVKHDGTDDVTEMPTSACLTTERIKGPLKIKVKLDSNAGRFSTQNFLVVYSMYKSS